MAIYPLPRPTRARVRHALPNDLIDLFGGAIAAAEARGADDLRQRVLAALNGTDETRPGIRSKHSAPKSDRAQVLVREVLADAPTGLLLHQIIGQVMSRDGRLQEGTVRAEVLSGDGVLYRPEKGRWHLIEEPAGRASEEAAPPTLEN